MRLGLMRGLEGNDGQRAAQSEPGNVIIGEVNIDAAARRITGPQGRRAIEPRAMEVLSRLAASPGKLVSRDSLLQQCWSGAPVGDDSLNRAIALLRRALREIAGEQLCIETVTGAGYILVDRADEGEANCNDSELASGLAAGWEYWKSGLPIVDEAVLQGLGRAAKLYPRSSEVRAMHALALRQAAEYAEFDQCADFVRDCEIEAKAALAIDPQQAHARAALVGLVPIFGDWTPRRTQLLELLTGAPDDMVALHELAILEMATGRVRAASELLAPLLDREPLASAFHYKRVYHCWSLGSLADMDRIADRAVQLWPRHSAIWFARLWTLAFTGRPHSALQQLSEVMARPPLPPPVFQTIERTLRALAAPDDHLATAQAVDANLRAAAQGPAQSVAATMYLSALGEIDGALSAAEGYLLHSGSISVSLHKTAADPSITDQHRRVTQMLFVPVTAPLRAHPGFQGLCERMGMTDYWSEAGIRPDFWSS